MCGWFFGEQGDMSWIDFILDDYASPFPVKERSTIHALLAHTKERVLSLLLYLILSSIRRWRV